MKSYCTQGLILACAALASCGGGSGDSRVAFTSLACPTVPGNSTIKEPEVEVINDPHRYLERYLSADLNSQEDHPEVDFDTQTVLAVYSGEKPSSGYSVMIFEVAESDTAITVVYVAKEPAASCELDAALTYPYCFVSIPKTDKPVNFSREVTTVSCH